MECFGPLAIIVIVATFLSYRTRFGAWQKLVDHTGLQFIPSFIVPKGVEGKYRGHRMKLSTFQGDDEAVHFRAEVNIRKRPSKFPLGKNTLLEYAPPSFRPVLSKLKRISFKLINNKIVFEVRGMFNVNPFWGGANNLINLVDTLSSVADAIEAESSTNGSE